MEYIYNITAAVDTAIAAQWVKEACASFLPALAKVPGVSAVELIEVHSAAAPAATRSYTVQVRFSGKDSLEAFLGALEREAESRLFERFGQRYLTFRLQLDSLHKIASTGE